MAAVWVYELTPWGADLGPVVVRLARWASRSPGMRYEAPLGTSSAVLALEALFDPAAATGVNATVALHIGNEAFVVRVAEGQLTVVRADSESPDATIESDPAGILAFLRIDGTLDEAITDSGIQVRGDRTLVDKLRQVFPVPDPVDS